MIYKKTLLLKENREHLNLPDAHIATGCKCDICGENCFSDEIAKNNKSNEYMSLKAVWGYFSKHDLETWSAEVCEACVIKHLEPLIKFKKQAHDVWTGKTLDQDETKIIEEDGH